jgi:hypothetical protein
MELHARPAGARARHGARIRIRPVPVIQAARTLVAFTLFTWRLRWEFRSLGRTYASVGYFFDLSMEHECGSQILLLEYELPAR